MRLQIVRPGLNVMSHNKRGQLFHFHLYRILEWKEIKVNQYTNVIPILTFDIDFGLWFMEDKMNCETHGVNLEFLLLDADKNWPEKD